MTYSIEKCKKLYALNKTLVESEIDFSRTVCFSSEIDLTEIELIRANSTDLRPTYTAFVAKAIAAALVEFPYANRRLFHFYGLPFFSFFQSFNSTDIAVAIERNVEGYDAVAYMEIIRGTHQKSLPELSQELAQFSKADLVSSQQWRDFYDIGTNYPSWLGSWMVKLPWFFPQLWKKYRGGSCIISSPAKYGVDTLVAAWPHPLGFSFGLAQKKPMVIGDEIKAVKCFSFVMNWDRRIMAGAQAARFFSKICDHLKNPTR